MSIDNDDIYDGIDLNLDLQRAIDDKKESIIESENEENDIRKENLNIQKATSFKNTKLLDFETFIIKKDYFAKVKEFGDSAAIYWKLGTFGNLVQMNIMKWWHTELIETPSNIVPIEEINNDPKFFLQYKMYGNIKKLKIPFGIGRTMKLPREHFNSKEFLLNRRDSRHQIIEFFVKPENADRWTKTWKDILFTKFIELGLDKELLDITNDRIENSSFNATDYYSEKFEFYYKFPFGSEKIASVSNRIDFDFQNEDDKNKTAPLTVLDPNTGSAFFPFIIRIRMDLDKFTLAILWNTFEKVNYDGVKNSSIVLNPKIAPIKAVVLPEDGSSQIIIDQAKNLYDRLSAKINIAFEFEKPREERIRHYRELGVPYFIFLDKKFSSGDKVYLFDAFKNGWLNLEEAEIWEYINKNSLLY
ncbi:MAG: hypothetical protein JXR48_06330 [Candidatus Delongbacteria bacterium]|nr:hypothetical protein [Candidatus Delongbacteria bacterium]